MICDVSVIEKHVDGQVISPEEHENSRWHQEDLVTGDELQDVLLVGGQFVQKVSDEHQAARPHRLQRKSQTFRV